MYLVGSGVGFDTLTSYRFPFLNGDNVLAVQGIDTGGDFGCLIYYETDNSTISGGSSANGEWLVENQTITSRKLGNFLILRTLETLFFVRCLNFFVK